MKKELKKKHGMMAGAVAYGAGGAAIGGAVVGWAGAAAGAAIGGLFGAIIGGFCAKMNPHEHVITHYTKPEQVVVKSEQIVYDAEDQAYAIERIMGNIEQYDMFKTMKQELQEKEDAALKQKQECENMIKLINNIGGKIKHYKTEMVKLQNQFCSGDLVVDQEVELIKVKLKKLSKKIKTMIEKMKSN